VFTRIAVQVVIPAKPLQDHHFSRTTRSGGEFGFKVRWPEFPKD
jgi:hypothetical protein